MIFEIKK